MKQIFPPVSSVRALIGTPAEKPGAYKLTQYCLRAPCADGELLYNTLTGELLLLPVGETEQQHRAELIARRFLVPAALDEYVQAKQLFSILRLTQAKAPVVDHFLVFTTSDCNARCYYCYELGRIRRPMSDEVADRSADYMLRVSGGKPLSLNWFGGEPLYNRAAIERICARLRDAGRPFHSSMVTNGYLFDEETVQTAVRVWGVRQVQIPLDGTEEVYNRAKAYIYRDDPSPFRRVIRNIGLLLDAGVTVNIRLNLGAKNFDDLMALSRFLAEQFPHRERLCVYVALLYDFGTAPQSAVDDEERLRRWRELTETLRDSGLQYGGLSSKVSINCCMADSDNHLTIMPDGSIGKCEHECDHEPVGHIDGGALDQELIDAWRERVEIGECRSCALFPQCSRLKKCAWTEADCLPLDREILRERILNRMRYSWEHQNSGSSAASADNDGGVC